MSRRYEGYSYSSLAVQSARRIPGADHLTGAGESDPGPTARASVVNRASFENLIENQKVKR
jgi:hypothetical protein